MAKKGLLLVKPHLCADRGPRAFANPWDLLRHRPMKKEKEGKETACGRYKRIIGVHRIVQSGVWS